MKRFHQILGAVFAGQKGTNSNEEWAGFHLDVDNETYSCPVLIKVADDGSFKVPWLPGINDYFSTDWNTEGEILIPKGSFGWAMEQHMISRDYADGFRLPEWPDEKSARIMAFGGYFPYLEHRILSNERKESNYDKKIFFYTPSHQDLGRNDWEISKM